MATERSGRYQVLITYLHGLFRVLPCVHGEARQNVTAATAVRSFFKPMAFHQRHIHLCQRASPRSLAFNLARLLRDMAHELSGCDGEFPYVSVGVTERENRSRRSRH